MIVKFLGGLDILSALAFWFFFFFNIIPEKIIILVAFYLLVKGVFFLISRDIASLLDIISSGIIFLSLNYAIPSFVAILTSLFLLQKGILSLLS